MGLTDGLGGGSSSSNGARRIPSPLRREGKQVAQRARCDSGTTYEQIARATGRSMQLVYDALNVNDDRRQITYADLLAMSRHSHTKAFVAHLLEPVEKSLKGPPPDGKR